MLFNKNGLISDNVAGPLCSPPAASRSVEDSVDDGEGITRSSGQLDRAGPGRGSREGAEPAGPAVPRSCQLLNMHGPASALLRAHEREREENAEREHVQGGLLLWTWPPVLPWAAGHFRCAGGRVIR